MKLTSRTTRSLASVAAVALLASGCSDDAGDQTNTTGGTPSPTGTPPTVTPETPSGDEASASGVSALDAHDAALEEVDGAVLSMDREETRWEVLVRGADGNGTEVWVDSTSGEVLEQRSEQVPSEAGNQDPDFTAKQAIDAALSVTSASGTVNDVDLERVSDTLVWDVTVEAEGGETTVRLGADRGDVITKEEED